MNNSFDVEYVRKSAQGTQSAQNLGIGDLGRWIMLVPFAIPTNLVTTQPFSLTSPTDRPPSFNARSNPEYLNMDSELASAIQNLVENLTINQVDIEPENRTALYSNLWNLYV